MWLLDEVLIVSGQHLIHVYQAVLASSCILCLSEQLKNIISKHYHVSCDWLFYVQPVQKTTETNQEQKDEVKVKPSQKQKKLLKDKSAADQKLENRWEVQMQTLVHI